ncbi:MAG: Lrp/AsnC ligand binding domain-containing protein [Thermoplasmatales archaeon]|nr:MAG: Lrp/AsnC ligand binding domain-containing protein [Thermoplasmatales archaeon]
MAIGFVLITVAPVRENYVYNELSKEPEIIELQPLFGKYDLLAKIKAEYYDELASIIINKIRTIAGVVGTKTLTGTGLEGY